MEQTPNPLKIVLVAPGIMPVPPPGWGALEILIWDLKQMLEKLYRCTVIIINTPNLHEIVYYTNMIKPDIVHIHYDVFHTIVPQLTCPNIILTSQYGYLEQKDIWFSGYGPIFEGFLRPQTYIHCVSEGIRQVYLDHGVDPDRLFVIPNGANAENFQFYEAPMYPDKTIYLGKIERRKRQYKYQTIPFVFYAGNYADELFMKHHPNYLGEWSKPMLYENLSKYANLMLLSDGECHPLVVAEALLCGLGVVVSEYAAANLDRSLPFITVIPTDKLEDIEYISEKTLENQKVSITMRKEIREYGLRTFGWEAIAHKYYTMYQSLLPSSTNIV